MAVRVVTPLFGHLGKTARGNVTPENDTNIEIPGMILPVLSTPFPTQSIFGSPQSPIARPVNSWMYNEQFTFNTSNVVDLIELGPGVWNITGSLNLRELGAITDPTCLYALNFFTLNALGSNFRLADLSAKQGLNQYQDWDFNFLVTTEEIFTFRRLTVAGLGTSINLAILKLIATRLF
jgi:hypothetical protein